ELNMRFLLHSCLKIDDKNAADYNATPCEVWSIDTFYTANDIKRDTKAKRDREGNLVLDNKGEPIIESVYKVIESKADKGWNNKGFDHKYEKIEPIYDPEFTTGYSGVMMYSNSSRRAAKGIVNAGGLHGERKVKQNMYYVELNDLKEFVAYIKRHNVEIEESPYPEMH